MRFEHFDKSEMSISESSIDEKVSDNNVESDDNYLETHLNAQAFGGSGILSQADTAERSVKDIDDDIFKVEIVIDTDPQEDVQSFVTYSQDRKGLQVPRDIFPRSFKTRLKKILFICENYFKD